MITNFWSATFHVPSTSISWVSQLGKLAFHTMNDFPVVTLSLMSDFFMGPKIAQVHYAIIVGPVFTSH